MNQWEKSHVSWWVVDGVIVRAEEGERGGAIRYKEHLLNIPLR
jgi:hypothetical protein